MYSTLTTLTLSRGQVHREHHGCCVLCCIVLASPAGTAIRAITGLLLVVFSREYSLAGLLCGLVLRTQNIAGLFNYCSFRGYASRVSTGASSRRTPGLLQRSGIASTRVLETQDGVSQSAGLHRSVQWFAQQQARA